MTAETPTAGASCPEAHRDEVTEWKYPRCLHDLLAAEPGRRWEI